MTQEQFANQVRVSRAALAKYEKNAREPDFEVIKRIAQFFNVSIDYLLEKDDGVIVIDIKELLGIKRKELLGVLKS